MWQIYFATLPREINELLILSYLSYDDIVEIRYVTPFDKLLGNDDVLVKLWIRDVSTKKYTEDVADIFVALTRGYFDFINSFNNCDSKKDKRQLVLEYDCDRLLSNNIELAVFNINITDEWNEFDDFIGTINYLHHENCLRVILDNLVLPFENVNIMLSISTWQGKDDFVLMIYNYWQKHKKPYQPDISLDELLLHTLLDIQCDSDCLFESRCDTVKLLLNMGANNLGEALGRIMIAKTRNEHEEIKKKTVIDLLTSIKV